METIKNKTKHVCQVLELGMNRWSTEDFEGIENTPYDIIMMDVMDACHYTFVKPYRLHRSSQVALVVKNLPANAGDITYLGLISGMATYSNILAWRIPWTEEPGRLQSTE